MQKNAAIARDLNDAQKDAVEIKETVKMLSGLPEEQVETLIAQLEINKEFGNPDRIRKEFFYRA